MDSGFMINFSEYMDVDIPPLRIPKGLFIWRRREAVFREQGPFRSLSMVASQGET
jgi:hypothetical protein